MTNTTVWILGLMAGALALCIALLQLLLSRWTEGVSLRKKIQHRLAPKSVSEAPSPGLDLGPVENWLLKAGFSLSPRRALALCLFAVAGLAGLLATRGMIDAGVAVLFLVTTLLTIWRVNVERQRRNIRQELPGILDSILRSLSVGRSLDASMVTAFGEASAVFEPIALRLRNAVAQGRDYTRVLDAFSDFYEIPAFTQIAIALRTSTRYGSSVKPVLVEVAKAIRSQQELRREFMAATAETRFTAAAFAILPPALAVYMIVLNEQFSQKLLGSDAGQTLVMASGAMQLVGILLILNLIRGVGRG